MKRMVFAAFCMFLVGTLIFMSHFEQVSAQVTYLSDGFESASFSSWSGTQVSIGEAISVSAYRSYIGAYSGRATSNGGGGTEYSFCYKSLSRSELYARGYFYVSKSGIADENDRFFFIIFKAGTYRVALAGWRKTGGTVKWSLTVRDGTGFVDVYSSSSPAIGRWYYVELHWKKGASNGIAEMWVDNALVCSASGNTATYGDITSAQCGLPQIVNCASTAVYFDNVKMSDSDIGPIFWGDNEIDFGYTIFADGFESASFRRWSGTTVYSGGVARVTGIHYAGTYGALFTSGTATSSAGQAYCYKNIRIQPGFHFLILNGYFRIGTCNIPVSTGRIYLLRLMSKGVAVVNIGCEKTGGALKWFLSTRKGAVTVYAYSRNAVLLNKWCRVTLTWEPGGDYTGNPPNVSVGISYVDGSPPVSLPHHGRN